MSSQIIDTKPIRPVQTSDPLCVGSGETRAIPAQRAVHRKPARDLPEAAAANATSQHACPQQTRPALPHPTPWATHLARAAMEVLCGSRPSLQLSGWATPAAITEFIRHSPAVAEPGRVRSVRAVRVGPAQIEAVVLVDCGERTRAMALRLQGVTIPARPVTRTPARHAPGPRWLATSMRLL